MTSKSAPQLELCRDFWGQMVLREIYIERMNNIKTVHIQNNNSYNWWRNRNSDTSYVLPQCF